MVIGNTENSTGLWEYEYEYKYKYKYMYEYSNI